MSEPKYSQENISKETPIHIEIPSTIHCWMGRYNQQTELVKKKDGRMVWAITKPKPYSYFAAEHGRIIYEGEVPYETFLENEELQRRMKTT